MSARTLQKAAEAARIFPQERHMSDLGNAGFLVERHVENIRYAAQQGKWLVWDGRRWQTDETGEVERLTKDTMRALLHAASSHDDFKEMEKQVKFAIKAQDRPRIEAAQRLAQTEPGIPILTEQLDSDPWLLNCQNGTINLRNGQLLAHRREHLITKVLTVAYDPDAQAPIWEQFLARIMNDDQELINFLQNAIGYSLTGLTVEQCLFYLFGLGSNGKSTLIETVFELLGHYAKRLSSEALMLKTNGGGIPNDVAMLTGARLVVASEVEEGAKLNEAKIKELTGSDTVTARFLHQEFFAFKPQFKLWIAGNHKPIIKGTDLGIWRRIRLIPFNATISAEEKDSKLQAKLLLELPGILAWAVRGCLAWQRDGLTAPKSVVNATANYRSESDLVGQFLDECCDLAPLAQTSGKVIYMAYRQWSETQGTRAMSATMLARKLTERGFEQRRSGGTQFIGISIATI